MNITPHDKGTYLVASRTREGEHIVDEDEGTCSCEWFNAPQNPHGTCAHLNAVRQLLASPSGRQPSPILAMTKAIKVRACKTCGKEFTTRRGDACPACQSKEWNSQNPLRRLYLNIKARAKRKKREFTMTFEYMAQEAVKAGYNPGMDNRSIDGLALDRKSAHLGYTNDNVRFIPYGENSRNLNATHDYNEETHEWTLREGNPF